MSLHLYYSQMEMHADSTLQVLEQQFETLEALRQKTLNTVSLVQNEINEILSTSIRDNRHNYSSPSRTSTPVSPRRDSQDGRNVSSSPQEGADGLQSDSGSTSTPREAKKKTPIKGSISQDDISQQKETFKSFLSFKIGTQDQEVRSPIEENYPDSGNDSLHLGMLRVSHLADEPSDAQLTSSVSAAVEDGSPLSASFPDSTKDLWSTLDKISLASRRMKEEIEKSQQRELALALELEQSVSPSSKELSYETPHSLQMINCPEDYVSRNLHLTLSTDVKSARVTELEHTVERLKNYLFLLEEDNLILNKQIRRRDLERSLQVCNHTSSHSSQDTRCRTQGEIDKDNSISKSCTIQRAQSDVGENPLERQQQKEEHKFESSLEKHPLENETKDAFEVKNFEMTIENLKNQCLAREERMIHLKQEKLEAERKLRKMKDYSNECVKKLQKLLHKCKELKSQNKTLAEQQKQQLEFLNAVKEERQQARDDKCGILRENDIIKSLLVEAHRSLAQKSDWNRQPDSKVAFLTGEVRQLTEELGVNKLETQRIRSVKETFLQASDEKLTVDCDNVMRNLQKEVDCLASPKLSTEQKVMDEIQNDPAKNSVGEDCEMLSVGVAKLKVDNRLLQQELQQCVQKNLQLKGIVQRQREERKVLEDCLFTVTSAKDILQLEVRKLQQDYLDLRKSISTQLRTKNLDASSGSLGLNEMLDFKDKERVYNSPKEQLAIDLIRKRLEEDELKRGTTEH